MKPEPILLVSTHLAPGGTRVALGIITEQLSTRGYTVSTVALYRGHGDATVQITASGNSHVLVETAEPRLIDYARAYVRLGRLIRELRPRAVLGVMPAANLLAGVCAKAARVPQRVACHHTVRCFQHPVMRCLDTLAMFGGIFTDVVCVSQTVADSFNGVHRYHSRMHVIPNGIPSFAVTRTRSQVRRQHGLSEREPILCMIGRLVPEKNVLAAVTAACRVPRVRLAVAGDGPLHTAAAAIIATAGAGDRVRLLGPLDHRSALELIHAADGFVQVSHYEGRSLALLEALMAKSPILASDIPAQREALTTPQGEIAALLCPPDDVEALSIAMSRLASEPQLRRDLSARAAQLGPTLDVGRMGDAYHELLDGFHGHAAYAPEGTK